MSFKDSQSYCAILFDDNNRQPIMRLHFKGKTQFVTGFGDGKEGTRQDIGGLEEIFGLCEAIKSAVQEDLQ